MKTLSTHFHLFYCFMLPTICFGQESTTADEQTIIAWVQNNAVPLRHVEAGNGFEDLLPLKDILKDVRVVGLGESTHGTSEFFKIKHRLLEFLVKEMNYTGFALEAPYFACQPINEYILSGKGDLYTALTGQGYVVWDTEEMVEMIKWMRDYNQNVSADKQVKFYGVDLGYQEIGRKEVLNYLQKVAPEMKDRTDSIFKILAEEELKWPTLKDSIYEKRMLQVYPVLQNLLDDLTFNKNTLVKKSSSSEFEKVLQNLKVIRQYILANTSALYPPFVDGTVIRSLSMAENLIYIMDQAGSESKIVVWEHNVHIAKYLRETIYLGSQLRKKFGESYYAISLELNDGSYQSRTILPDKRLGDLKEIIIKPASESSWPRYLSNSNIGNMFLDFRGTSIPSNVRDWINSPQIIFSAGWVDSEGAYPELELGKSYDGMIFIQTTSPTRPTANALKTVAERKGL